MAREKYTVPPIKDNNDFDDDYDNEGFDEFSDDYEEDDRYGYSNSLQSEADPRRGNGFSCGGSGQSSYEVNEDSRKDHHNQLERKRRASIKSSYCELREAIPTLRDNKASRSVILQKAVEYLEELHRRNMDHVACVDHFSTENSALETKCREIENQVQMLLRQQQRNNCNTNGYGNGSFQNYNSSLSRPSYRVMDEDSNDLSGSTNSTPNASTSRSIISSTSASTNRNGTNGLSSSVESQHSKFDNIDGDNIGNQLKDEENGKISSSNDKLSNIRNETGSNSSSIEYFDDLEDVVAAKKPRKT